MRQHPLAFETIHNASGCQEGRLIKKNWKIVKAAAAKKVETVIGSMRTTVVRLYLKRSGEVHLQVKIHSPLYEIEYIWIARNALEVIDPLVGKGPSTLREGN